MARARVILDRAGIGSLLRSAEFAAATHELASQVAANVDAQGLTASSGGTESGSAITGTVTDYVTDRAASSVTITHPAGIAMQAKHGVLTKAAAQAGLEVR